MVRPRLRHGVIWNFANKLKKNPSELEILNDGKQVRSYVHVDDAVEAAIIAWEKGEHGFEVYNVASGGCITAMRSPSDKGDRTHRHEKGVQVRVPRGGLAT
jgi:UDP-glucose 4-epimerase